MNKSEILKKVSEQLSGRHQFIKWWRKENDFSDYDLVDRFLGELSPNDEIDGVSLLTMEEMWDEVKKLCGDNVRLINEDNRKIIGWLHKGEDGKLKSHSCDYLPENLLQIFDTESRGNPMH
jgi:hypothetical protein